MGKKLSFILVLASAIFLILVNSKDASATHREDVLGDSTSASRLSLPSSAEGPGLILPDSPLFFLDSLKQNIRLFFAFSPSQKAKVHAAIAGERLAELQFMLAKNDSKGIRTALLGVSDNLKKAALDLSNAKLEGQDVKQLARTTNDSIKDKQEKLSLLEDKAKGELKAQVKTVKEALKAAKVEVEDNLPEDELENEIKDDIEDEIEDHTKVASDSAKGLAHAIDVLSKLASQAAEKQQTRREEALRHAIEVKSEALKKQQEQNLEIESKAEEKLLKAREKVIEKAREAARKLGEGAKELREVQHEIKSTSEVSQPSSSGSSSGGSSSSGSGSSSNSGDSGSKSGDKEDKSGKD